MPFHLFWQATRSLETLGLPALSRQSLAAWLQGLSCPAVFGSGRSVDHARYTFHHFIEYVLRVLAEHLGSTLGASGASDEAPAWSAVHVAAVALLEHEIEGVVADHKAGMTFEDWSAFLRSECRKWVPLAPSADFVRDVLGRFVPFVYPPTRTMALVILATPPFTDLFLGQHCGGQARRQAIATLADMPVHGPPPGSPTAGVAADLAAALHREWRAKQQLPRVRERGAPPSSSKKMSRTSANIREMLAEKTKQLRFAIVNRIPWDRVPQTLADAAALVLGDENDDKLRAFMEDLSVSRWTLMRHLLILDVALEKQIARDIEQRRDAGTFLGVCLATDESPPEEPRFAGVRLQVTRFYIAFLEDPVGWESAREPPIKTLKVLAGIVHCPG